MPFLVAVAIVLVYAACTHVLLSANARLTLTSAILTALPLIATLYAFLFLGGRSGVTLSIAAPALITFVAIYKLISKVKPQRMGIVIFTAPIVYLSFAIGHLISPIEFARIIGSYAIFSVFLGVVSLLLLAAFVHPRIGISLFGALLVVYLLTPNDHSVHLQERRSQRPGTFNDWVEARRDLEEYKEADLPYPVVFISSEGGGIYAAAHTYAALSILAKRCPTFTQHIYVAVGVSGGAIGNALFNATVEEEQRAYAPCSPGDMRIDTTPFVQDHLSPVLARFLLIEPIERLLPGQWLAQDRASLLTESFRRASQDSSYLSKSIRESWNERSARPALAAVATKMSDGQRFVLSPVAPAATGESAEWWPNSVSDGPDISIIEAAGVSARFPWITPTARLQLSDESARILADGGYFENSGAETVTDYINDLKIISSLHQAGDEIEKQRCGRDRYLIVAENFRKNVKWDRCSVHVFPIHLAIASSALGWEAQKKAAEGLGLSSSFLIDPLTTLLSTRSARGTLALNRANLEHCGSRGGECMMNLKASMGFFLSAISPGDLELPLGWYISQEKVRSIAEQAIPSQAFDYLVEENDNENDISRLIYHFDLRLYGADANPKVEELLGAP
ncbi:hypothetical protein HFN88_32540 [Rhizobium laguerreae]|uniref:patatin-like phospholipase family protein n=1 Tax=Rhizobium laguerreae TaxID=1076926 RepID=UPI001C91612C|nr:patatin-like phospholipase family protein [Rhizobium laguerreae]MBY3397366.1 hypothetical protein [Rhizobium laguerreae]MBY3417226.1 hypothetical protein [Rhizobium laguerreae]MBY3503201.1 hypothetical protein [Rhizobium laguerreae]